MNLQKRILTGLKNVSTNIEYAVIKDKKGKVFAFYKSPLDTTADHITDFLTGGLSQFTTDRLIVSNDIVDEKEKLGTVFLETNLNDLERLKTSVYKMATILLLIAVGFSFLVAIVVQEYISKRLLNLVNKVANLNRDGDYGVTLPDEGKDEIGTLIRVFNNMLKKVQENQQKKDEFIGIASHELKTPLTSVKGYLELMLRIKDEEMRTQFAKKSMISVNKLEKLIRELLDVSRIQSGQLMLNKQPFDLDLLIEETISDMQINTKTHLITRENNLAGQFVIADRQRIEQVLINLLSNAVKYSPGEKEVFVESTATEAGFTTRIRDFGTGVPLGEHTNIFERFYRSTNNSIHISGFGLGLYICKDIINRHGGKIWIESEKQGSSFYFTIPNK